MRGAGCGNVVGDAAFAVGERSAVTGAAVSAGASRGVWNLRAARRCRRLRFRGVYKTVAPDAGTLSTVSEKDGVVSAGRGRVDRWRDAVVRAATPGRGISAGPRSPERRHGGAAGD